MNKPEKQIWDYLHNQYQDTLKVPTIYRLDWAAGRFYYTIRGSKVRYYLSVSSFTKAVLPTSEFLVKWKADHGYEEADRLADLAAHYGTFMHDECIGYLINEKWDRLTVIDRIHDYLSRHYLSHSLAAIWHNQIISDMIAWMDFVYTYKVIPIAVEYPVVGNAKLPLAGRIDVISQMSRFISVKTGQPPMRLNPDIGSQIQKGNYTEEIVNAIIDLKSGRKAFYESHELQINTYKDIFNAKYGKHFKIDRVYNWRPKDWRSETGSKYAIKDQTDSPEASCIPDYIKIAKKKNILTPTGTFKYLTDQVNINTKPSNQYKVNTLDQHILRKHGKGI